MEKEISLIEKQAALMQLSSKLDDMISMARKKVYIHRGEEGFNIMVPFKTRVFIVKVLLESNPAFLMLESFAWNNINGELTFRKIPIRSGYEPYTIIVYHDYFTSIQAEPIRYFNLRTS